MTKARDIASATPAPSTVSATELGYLDGVSSAIQTQIDGKSGTSHNHNSDYIAKTLTTTTGDIIYASAANTPARLGIGSTNQVLTVSGGIPAWAAASSPSFVGVSLYSSVNVSAANNTQTVFTFDSELFDTNGFHSTSSNTGRITIPTGKAGYYLISGTLVWVSNSTGYRSLTLTKNGTSSLLALDNASSDGGYQKFLNGTVIANLAEGDYVTMDGTQNSGGALNMRGQGQYYTNLFAQFLGA